jgi:hypothetical protein
MNQPQLTIMGRVTAASATSVQVTPHGDTWDSKGSGTIATITISGSNLAGFHLNDPLAVRITTG